MAAFSSPPFAGGRKCPSRTSYTSEGPSDRCRCPHTSIPRSTALAIPCVSSRRTGPLASSDPSPLGISAGSAKFASPKTLSLPTRPSEHHQSHTPTPPPVPFPYWTPGAPFRDTHSHFLARSAQLPNPRPFRHPPHRWASHFHQHSTGSRCPKERHAS